MKVLVVSLVVLVTLIGCSASPAPEVKVQVGGGVAWSIIRSPLTGRCYELVNWEAKVGAMHAIDCDWQYERGAR